MRTKVYNLTDQPTAGMKAAGLVNMPIRVAGEVLPPGKSVVVNIIPGSRDQKDLEWKEHQKQVAIGAPPKWYKLPPPEPDEALKIMEPNGRHRHYTLLAPEPQADITDTALPPDPILEVGVDEEPAPDSDAEATLEEISEEENSAPKPRKRSRKKRKGG